MPLLALIIPALVAAAGAAAQGIGGAIESDNQIKSQEHQAALARSTQQDIARRQAATQAQIQAQNLAQTKAQAMQQGLLQNADAVQNSSAASGRALSGAAQTINRSMQMAR